MIIETARLRLRCLRTDEAPRFAALANHWEIARWLAALPHPYLLVDAQNWIREMQHRHQQPLPRSFAICLKATDEVIGGGGLDGSTADGSERPALGYWLGLDYQGQGYGQEAATAFIDYGFNKLGLTAIEAYADPDNVRSQKLLQAVGMQPDGLKLLAKPTRNGSPHAPTFIIHKK